MKQKEIIYQFGIILGVGSVLFSVVQFLGDFLYSQTLSSRIIFGILPYIYFVLCLFISIYLTNKQKNQSFSSLLKTGLGVSLIASLIISVYFLFFITILSPDFLTKLSDLQQLELEKIKPDLSQEVYLQTLENIKNTTKPFWQFSISLATNLFFGLFVSAGLSGLFILAKK